MSTTIVTTLLLLMVAAVVNGQGESGTDNEKYVYGVLYDEESCRANAVSMYGFVTNEESNVAGGGSANETSSETSVCHLHYGGELCQNQLVDHVAGSIIFSVNRYNVVVECDSTNLEDQGLCRFLEQCVRSSLVRGCKGRAIPASELFRHPEWIVNTENPPKDANYMLFYSDNGCNTLEGIKGLVPDPYGQDLTLISSTTTSCKDAMACLFNPDGPSCQDGINESDRYVRTFYSEMRNDGQDVYECTAEPQTMISVQQAQQDVEDGLSTNSTTNSTTPAPPTLTCTTPAPSQCVQSPIASCYYRWVSATQLLGDPAAYFGTNEENDNNNGENDTSLATVLPTGFLFDFVLLLSASMMISATTLGLV